MASRNVYKIFFVVGRNVQLHKRTILSEREHLEATIYKCICFLLTEENQNRNIILEGSEMQCQRRIQKIKWIDSVKNEVGLLYRVKEERNIQHGIKRRKANWTGHILRNNCLLKYVIKGELEDKVEGKRRGRRRRKQLSSAI